MVYSNIWYKLNITLHCFKYILIVLFLSKGRFNEDGSFIGQYGTLRRQQMQQQVANAAAAAAAARAAAQAQAIGPGTYV